MQNLRRIALWLCQAWLALMFFFAGSRKFTGSMWARMFERWGYPDHFYLLVGAVEVACAVALLVPRTASFAALTLIVIMMGAGLTHLMHGEQQRLPQIAIMSLLLAAVAYGRWHEAIGRKMKQ
jgi:uncharacterized membrane protein YphA (DoxX/SURF4 family)